MDVYTIKTHIINNPEYIRELLENVGFCKVTPRGKEYRCAYDEDTNATSIRVDKETLGAVDFSRGINGDIITLIQNKTGKTFRDSLNYICDIVGLDSTNIKREEITLPFGGFFKNISKNKDKYETLNPIDENELNNYKLMPSKLFCEDGIPPEYQVKYEIGYDSLSGRIIIPHRDTRGNLIGIVGRYNSHELEDGMPKYYPIIPFAKSKSLYGFDKNYTNIQNSKVVILPEAEKSVMKLDLMGIQSGLAIGGDFISDFQTRNIQSTSPNIVIVAFDEGLEEEYIREQAKKVKMQNPFFDINVGYIWDKDNEIMKKGTKSAPMDGSKTEFQYLLSKCTKFI